MKGVALSIETIVILILAVTVLSILLYFFTSQAGPAQSRYQLEMQRTQACGSYVNLNPRCESNEHEKLGRLAGSEATKYQKTLSQIVEACGKLGIPGCSSPASLACIQKCCIFCAKEEAEANS